MSKRAKKNYMQDGTFAELMRAAEQALAYERGARDGYKVVQVESPKSLRMTPVGEALSQKTNLGSRRKHKKVAAE